MNSFNTIPPQPFPPSSSEDGMQGAAIKKLQNDVSGLKTDVLQLSNTKANQSNIAPSFNAETSYTVGDYVTYEGQTYKCTTDHTGAWNADNFTETTVATELNGLNSKITTALENVKFAVLDFPNDKTTDTLTYTTTAHNVVFLSPYPCSGNDSYKELTVSLNSGVITITKPSATYGGANQHFYLLCAYV